MKDTDSQQQFGTAPISVSIERILPGLQHSKFIDGFCYDSDEATYLVYADVRARLGVALKHADYLVDLYIHDERQSTFYLSELGYRSLIRQKNIQQAYRPELNE
ncbi:hypothetical protein [Agarilytica rhodophyticola]|uniref:hypothetical protein n=1 Tax=Agarilytica rhodophyticola TaxID=1737490 RepID=UPI000B344DDE|nr:hypothetical protein [Agarilytica rhodophyticola]